LFDMTLFICNLTIRISFLYVKAILTAKYSARRGWLLAKNAVNKVIAVL
jgi:hypothetical protein